MNFSSAVWHNPDGNKNFYLFFKVNEKILFFIKKNQTLIYLNLNGNKIGNKGGMAMAQMLQVNFILQHLDIGNTDQVLKLDTFKRNIKIIFFMKNKKEIRKFNCIGYNSQL